MTPKTETVRIRPAVPEDGPRLTALVRGLIRALGDDEETFDDERFLSDAFAEPPQFELRVAEQEGGELLGYALFHDAYEPSHAARGTYLCDLFVVEQARRRGVGRMLMDAVVEATRARERSFVWWVVRPESSGARAFYRTLTDVRVDVSAEAMILEA